MEFFNKAKTVRFRSHLDKFLVADDDEETVRQSRNGSSQRAHWTVEFVDGKSHVVRLKSCHDWYLTASDEPFLLGMTGKKVMQAAPTSNRDTSVEWEPIKEGELYVKLRSKGGKFLRANGGTPPWRNSVTHDFPYRSATQDWVLWEIEVVDVSDYDIFQRFDSTASDFSLGRRSDFSSSYTNSPMDSPQAYHKKGGREFTISDTQTLTTASHGSLNSPRRQSTGTPLTKSDTRTLAIAPRLSLNASRRQNGMIFFNKAKAVRLQNHHGKYLVADDDETTVRQSRNGSSQRARWTVEYITGKENKIRLKSFHGLYLTASNDPFLLGMTGKKVVQFLPPTKSDSSTEWEPIKEGFYLKLKTNDGNFLRANWGTPPWRNSVTHDIPQRTATQDWVLWEVEVVDILIGEELGSFPSFQPAMSSFSSFNDGVVESPKKDESRLGFSGRSRDLSSNDKVHFYNASTLF